MSVAMPAIAERRYAGAIVRAIAFFIDAIALLLLNTAINTVVRRADVSAFVDAAYFVLLWSAPLGGQTLGMRLVGIRLTTVDGHPPSLIAAVIRFIGLVLGAVFGFLGLIWIVFDRRKQGWHDLIAGTYVIHLDDTAGQPVSGAPFDFTAASGIDLIFCPRCGTEQRRAVYCAACGADMALGPIERRAGITYVLNQLADWERAHVIDATGRSRLEPFLRAQLGALVGAASQPAAERAHVVDERVESAAIPRAVDARPAPPRSFEIFADAFKTFAVDETPSLFLYVGAFLVVVSALIFVNVSGEQISDTTRLALVLLGTIAFLVAGLALHRVPRVLPAARTFLAIGALLVPADILAGYALVLRRPPLDAPTLWLAGSLLAALLYAALAVRGYGAWYAPLFVVALISAVGAFDVQLDLSAGWTIASYAILALTLLLAGDRLPFALAPLAKPLPRAAQILAASIAVFAALSYPAIDASAGNERWAPVATALTLTAFAAASGWRARVWAGWAALGGAGLTALLAVHALRPPLEWYGVALAALSWTYAALGFRTAPGTSTRFQALSLATTAAALSLTPIASYERAPLAGVVVFGAIGVLALAVPRDAQPRFRLPRTEFDQPLLYLALLSAHLVWRYAVMAAVSSFRAYDPRDLAYAWFPLAVAILAASGAPWRATRARAASLAVAGVTSAAVVTLASIGDAGANALFAASFAAIVAALAITAGVTRALWIAASFAAFAALGLLRWAAIPHEWWTLLLSTIAIAAGAVAAIVDLGRFRRIAQELALAWQALSAAVGFWFVVAGTRGSRLPVDELVWQTAAVSLLVLAALVWLESRRGGEGLEALGASAAVVAVLLMEIARLHPSELQAYSIPLGLYLLAVAIVAPQVPRLRPSAASLEIAGATALQVPALVRSAETDGEPHLVIALVASLAVLYLGTKARRPMLVRAAAVGIALGGVSATHQPGALSVYALVAAAAAIAFALVPHIDIGEREREFLEGAGAIAALAPLAAGAVSTPNAVYVVTFVAVAVVLFASGACCGRRVLCGAAEVGVLATPVIVRLELFEWPVVVGGMALLILALCTAVLSPNRLPRETIIGAELVGAFAMMAPPFALAFAGDVLRQGAVFIGAVIAVSAAALIFEREALLAFSLTAAAIATLRALAEPHTLAVPSALGGVGLVALSLWTPRLRRARLPRHALALDVVGAFALFGPIFVRSWDPDGFAYGVGVVGAAIALIVVSVVIGRRNMTALGLGALGLSSIHGLVDVVNRLPNWALFAIAGATLLAAGFVLLLKRETWTRWQQRTAEWWESRA